MSFNYPRRGDIYWVDLDPTVGSEIKKVRPALVISNDSSNEILSRVIVAPITSSVKKIFSFEVKIEFDDVSGKILLDQIRCVDKMRLKKKIMRVDKKIMLEVDSALKITLALL